MRIADHLGVQSFCFRGFKDNASVAEQVKACGLSRIELCGVHADFNDRASFAKVIEIYRNAGVEICSIGVQSFSDQETVESDYFEFARMAGARVITADFSLDRIPECFATASRLADRYGINLAIHNHGGRHWLGSRDILAKVFSQTSERIGLCLDTAWALDSGEDPVAMAEAFAGRLYGVHFKDFTFDSARRPHDVVVGTGNLDLAGLLAVLDRSGFDGVPVLEYEGDVDNPVPALSACVAALRGEE